MKRRPKDDTPEGGWQGPPITTGLKPLRIATKVDKKGNWIWTPVKQKKKDKKLRKEWERRMTKASKKGQWHFPWPPQK